MKRNAPIISPDDTFFWEGVAAGELRLQRCAGCSAPADAAVARCVRPAIPSNGAIERASGRGTVYSWVIPRHRRRRLRSVEPPIVVLVELEEGVRLVSNLVRGRSPKRCAMGWRWKSALWTSKTACGCINFGRPGNRRPAWRQH